MGGVNFGVDLSFLDQAGREERVESLGYGREEQGRRIQSKCEGLLGFELCEWPSWTHCVGYVCGVACGVVGVAPFLTWGLLQLVFLVGAYTWHGTMWLVCRSSLGSNGEMSFLVCRLNRACEKVGAT